MYEASRLLLLFALVWFAVCNRITTAADPTERSPPQLAPGSAPVENLGRVDLYAPFRAAARRAVKQKDAIAAEKLLMEMPDVNLMLAVDNSDDLLVELVMLGDPDRLRNYERYNGPGYYFRYSAEREDTEMIRTLLKCKIPLPEEYNGWKWAAIHGKANVVQAFIDGGANLNACDKQWSGTALHQAICSEHDKIFDMLLEAGADVNIVTDYGWSPLHAAARVGRADYAEKLLAKGAKLHAKLKSGVEPVHEAVIHQKLKMARWLVKHGAMLDAHVAAALGDLKTVRKLYPDPLATDPDMPGFPSPVFMAAYGNQVAVVRYFIEAGLDVEIAEDSGITLLIYAADGESPDVVKYLLEKKADPYRGPTKAVYSRYATPLHRAAASGNLKTLALLLDHGMPVDHPTFDGETPLVIAAQAGKVEAIRLLLKHGANVDGLPGKLTPLVQATFRQHVEVCRVLLEGGANPNGREDSEDADFSVAPITRAVDQRQTEIFDLLVKHGARVKTSAAYSTLHHCVSGGDPRLIRRLLDLGAEVNKPFNRNGSFLEQAVLNGRPGVARMMIEAGASIGVKKNSVIGIYAGRLGDVVVMQALLEQGLDLTAKHTVTDVNKTMHTALDAAAVHNKKDMIRFLIAQGMDPNKTQKEFGGLPLIVQAARAGAKLAVLELLKLEDGPKIPAKPALPDRPDPQTRQPLMFALRVAAEKGHVDTFGALLRHGAWKQDQNAAKILASVSSRGDYQMLKLLIKHVPREQFPSLQVALRDAVTNRKPTAVEFLLDAGGDPNVVYDGGDTLLHRLARADKTEQVSPDTIAVVELLLRHGAKPDLATANGLTPAHVSVLGKKMGLARLLIARGAPRDIYLAAALDDVEYLKQQKAAAGDDWLSADAGHPRGVFHLTSFKQPKDQGFSSSASLNMNLLTWAAGGGAVEVIRWLATLDSQDLNGGEYVPPICVALDHRHLPAVRALLKAGANPNGNEKCGVTLLQAAILEDKEAIKLLLEHKASPQQMDENGKTALHLATQKQNLSIIKLLVEAGVPLDATWRSTTALELVARSDSAGAREICAYLLKAGADPQAGRGEVLYWEVRYGKPAVVEKLLQAGLDPNTQTEAGDLPLHGAIQRYADGKKPHGLIAMEMIRLLLKHNADPEVPNADVKTAIQFATERKIHAVTDVMRAAVKPR